MNQLDYFTICKKTIGLCNKEILEIGGAIPISYVSKASPLSWTSIDINERRFDDLDKEEANKCCYKSILMDATKMDFPDNSFDVVFSGNCFEHIENLTQALDEIYRVLKPNGILFTIFSPIWSGPVGHHTWVWDGDSPITFNSGVFPHWHHLVKSPKELKLELLQKYSEDLSEKIVQYVYYSNDLNRLLDTDYEQLLDKYGYYPIIKYALKFRGHPPQNLIEELKKKNPEVNDFRTQGYFLVLSKGGINTFNALFFRARGWYSVICRKLMEANKNLAKTILDAVSLGQYIH
jgi:ubiquinone/menaquinone biosynthesis C-methylase UbiE